MSAKSHTDAAWRARARVTQSLDRVKIVPQLAVWEGANVAILRQMRGKIAKSLSCNGKRFNIITLMTPSADPGRNRCGNARFDPPIRQPRRVQKLMTPSRIPEKKFTFSHNGVLTHERPQAPRQPIPQVDAPLP